MEPFPPFNAAGDLPPGIHGATIAEVLRRFGEGSAKRRVVAQRLVRVHSLAAKTRAVARFIVFGSFVTSKPDPNDVDIFRLMEDSFDVSALSGDTALLFNHSVAQAYFGTSIFWLRRFAAFNGEQ